MKITIIVLLAMISCKSPDTLKGYFFLPDNINWESPNSGIEEIDIRKLASFPVIYFKTDSIFYVVSSTNELINDSIAFGVETGFKIDKCVLIEKHNNELIFEKETVYSVVKMDKNVKKIKERVESLNNNSFVYEGVQFLLDKELSDKSKNKIKGIIDDFGK